ncbi:MAG: DUF4062 domain-containing protein [Lewinellaceae bacterium]|nr:DUF4062 domain-containing protein [Lewinellaceae bacterium]
MRRKLQVFISSTYEDMKVERQAAVAAILAAGHIPAGMELFTAGDKSQIDTINKWIYESDVFMLILGGRYGTIEPGSQKSYIHLEYEQAEHLKKPLFAIMMDDNALEEKVKREGSTIMERTHFGKYEDFRNKVKSKVVRFFKDEKDIRLAILEKLNEMSKITDLGGWVRSEEADALKEQNELLNDRLKGFAKGDLILGLQFEELSRMVSGFKYNAPLVTREMSQLLNDYQAIKNNLAPDELVVILHTILKSGEIIPSSHEETLRVMKFLRELGLMDGRHSKWTFTKDGTKYVLRLKAKGNGSS